MNKILPLVLVLSISLVMGNQLPDAYGAKPNSIVVELTAAPGGGLPNTIHVENKDGVTDPTDPCDSPAVIGPCPAPVEISAVGDKFTVFGGGGDFTNETFFYLGIDDQGDLFVFTNKDKESLHTSCSAPLIGETGSVNGYTLKVLSQQGGSGSHCPEDVVGGHGGPIDKTALLVTGAQLNASWMIPVLVSAIGIGLFVVTRKS